MSTVATPRNCRMGADANPATKRAVRLLHWLERFAANSGMNGTARVAVSFQGGLPQTAKIEIEGDVPKIV